MRFFARRSTLRVLPAALVALALAACGSGIDLDEPIEGPVWRLAQVGDQPIAAGTEPQRDPHLQFDANSGRVSGSGGCNRISGSFTRSGSALRMEQLVSTRMACADPAHSAVETQFFAALQTTVSYRLQGPGRMSLLDAGGRTLATLSSNPR